MTIGDSNTGFWQADPNSAPTSSGDGGTTPAQTWMDYTPDQLAQNAADAASRSSNNYTFAQLQRNTPGYTDQQLQNGYSQYLQPNGTYQVPGQNSLDSPMDTLAEGALFGGIGAFGLGAAGLGSLFGGADTGLMSGAVTDPLGAATSGADGSVFSGGGAAGGSAGGGTGALDSSLLNGETLPNLTPQTPTVPTSAGFNGTFTPPPGGANPLSNLFGPSSFTASSPLDGASLGAGTTATGGGILQSILGPINNALGTNIGPGNLIGTALQSYFANNTAGKLQGAASQVLNNSSILNPTQRSQVQGQLTNLFQNPSQFMSTDPYVQALTAQMQKTIPASVAKSGNPANVLDQVGSQFATSVANEYTGLANSMTSALNPGYSGAATAPLLGTSAMVGSQGLASLGNLFGSQPGSQWTNMFKPASNSGGPLGSQSAVSV